MFGVKFEINYLMAKTTHLFVAKYDYKHLRVARVTQALEDKRMMEIVDSKWNNMNIHVVSTIHLVLAPEIKYNVLCIHIYEEFKDKFV